MAYTPGQNARFQKISLAFSKDGWKMLSIPDPDAQGSSLPFVVCNGSIGAMAEMPGGRYDDRRPQRAYYVEGGSYETGYLMGLMAEADIWRMADEYTENVIFDFINMKDIEKSKSPFVKKLKELIVDIIYEESKPMAKDVPPEYQEELKGMADGCKRANPARYADPAIWTELNEHLWGLNYGIDCLLAHIYTGRLFEDKHISPHKLNLPIMCNAFSLTGAAAGGKHFFGRDFMFPTAGVFQDVACFIVYGRDPATEGDKVLHLSHTAPGMVGTVCGLNEFGVAIGIEMVPTMLVDAENPGFNSLGLNRHVVKYGKDLPSSLKLIQDAPRGVSWIYALAAEKGAAIVETGRVLKEGEAFPNLDPVSKYYRKRLPAIKEINDLRASLGNPDPVKGTIVRYPEYRYPSDLLKYNPGLWKAFNCNIWERFKEFLSDFIAAWAGLFKGQYSFGEFWHYLWDSFVPYVKYNPSGFGQRGFLQADRTANDLPAGYYFAPQREERDDLVLVTNAMLTPEMRLQAMAPWTTLLAASWQKDFQWRYDEFNSLIQEKLDGRQGALEEAEAWKLINYLTSDPSGPCSEYYNPGYEKDWRGIIVGGSVSLCELTEKRITSLFGYYGDKPVTINLMNFNF